MGGDRCMLIMMMVVMVVVVVVVVVVVDKCHMCDILKCRLLCLDGIRSFMSGSGDGGSERSKRRR